MLSGDHFDLLGYFALGIFVGSITSHLIKFAKDFQSSASAIATILPAALGGTALTFLQLGDKAKHAMPAYAIGLLIGLMWALVRIAVENIKDTDGRIRLLGWLHIGSVSLLSVYSAWMFVWQGAIKSP
jgi:hypothetical protein